MKKVKIKVVLVSLLIAMITVNSLIVIGSNLISSNQSNFSIEYPDIESKSIINLDMQDFNVFSQEFPLFGYKLIAEAKNPIDWDEEGLITLTQKNFNFMDLILKLEAGEYNYTDIPIYGTLYMDRVGTQAFCYHLEDPLRGFFMEMDIFSDMTYIDLAFDGGECQLCYEGLVSSGHSIFKAYFTQKIEVIHMSEVNLMNPEFKSLSFAELEYYLKEQQKNNIKIYQRDSENDPKAGIRMSFIQYGIAHEQADFSSVNLAERLPDDFWEPFSEIDIGIYRRVPGESKIKSDLQYYNMDYDLKYCRDIKAYAIYAHSHQDKGTAWWMKDNEWLYPSEIKALWYTQGYYDVHPWDMIIHATVCYGYAESSSILYMPRAFVGDGAAAFVGATLKIPAEFNDLFTDNFWDFLCQQDKTVKQSTEEYIRAHNLFVRYFSDPEYIVYWYYGVQIKVYGNENAKLDN